MIYFVPGEQTLNRAILAAVGLADVLDAIQYRFTARGPTGSGGMLVASTLIVDGKTYLPEYDAERQTWSKRFGGDCWLGIDPDRPVLPKFLARDKVLTGRNVTLRDGRAWTIPQLKVYTRGSQDGPILYTPRVPRFLRQDPDTGLLVPGDVVPEYSELWNQSVAVADYLVGAAIKEGSATLDDQTAAEFAASLLRCNYRLGKPEIDALRLFDETNYTEVVKLAIDWEGFMGELGNRLRRRASAGTPSPSGNTTDDTESTTTTTPPSANTSAG